MQLLLSPVRYVYAILAVALLVVVGIAVNAPKADAASCPSAKFVTSNAQGSWDRYADGSGGAYNLNNNEWNGSHGPQTLFANSVNDWGVCSSQPNLGGAVETYPNVEVPYYALPGGNAPISQLTADRSSFAETMPDSSTNFIGEAAFDLWLNNWNIEVMVWTDNHKQVPFGHKVATASFFGQNFDVWQSGSDAFAFVLDHNEQSGTVHILSTLRWLIKHGKIPSSSTITSAQFGWEVCATTGSQVFHMSKYVNTTLPAKYSPAGK
jgi:hypothetical protein